MAVVPRLRHLAIMVVKVAMFDGGLVRRSLLSGRTSLRLRWRNKGRRARERQAARQHLRKQPAIICEFGHVISFSAGTLGAPPTIGARCEPELAARSNRRPTQSHACCT